MGTTVKGLWASKALELVRAVRSLEKDLIFLNL